MILNLDNYDSALVNLALRQMATSEFTKAVAELKAGNTEAGKNAMERGEAANRIAEQLSQG